MEKILRVEHLKKYYSNTCALEDISFEVERGEFVVVIGPSGAGKSTVMRCINRLITPTGGNIIFEGKNIASVKGKRLIEARRKIGMIFQHFNLVYRLTVFQNVMHGRLGYISTVDGVLGKYSEEDKRKALKLLEQIGLGSTIYKRAGELSGGQKQRVGIARALMQEPSLMLCDEPIASLDPNTSKVIMDLLEQISQDRNIACIVSLHQVEVAMKYATRIIGIRDGVIVFDDIPSKLTKQKIEEIYGNKLEELNPEERVQKVV